MSEQIWYYLQNNNQVGPVSETDLRAIFASGQLPADTLVWAQSLANWTPAAQTSLLAGAPAQAAAAAPPAPAPAAYAAPAAFATPAASAGPAAAVGAAAVSPSETILLRGEQFAKKAAALVGGGNYKVLASGAEVGYIDLARAMLCAALLANEQAGTVQLATRQKKAMLGLRTVNYTSVESTGREVAWPSGSLEAAIQAMTRKQPVSTDDLYYTLFREETTNAWAHMTDIVAGGLYARNLATVEKRKSMKLFTVAYYALTPEGAALAPTLNPAPLLQLLNGCQTGRPELWKMLIDSINRAAKLQTESSDNDFGPND